MAVCGKRDAVTCAGICLACFTSGRQSNDRGWFWQMYSSAENGFCAKASSRIPLSHVRDHVMESGWVWPGDCGRRLISAATASRSGTDIELLELVALVAPPPQGGG